MRSNKNFLFFTAFEISLAIFALVLIYLFGPVREDYFRVTLSYDFFLKLFVSVIFLVGVAFVFAGPFSSKLSFLKDIRKLILDSFMGEFIRKAPAWQFLVVSMAAGLGEEMLFRLFLQEKFGLILASLVFGLCHALSFTYFTIATLMGLYLGCLYEYSDKVILVPILAHGAYDFTALILYRRFNAAIDETTVS